MKKIIRVEPLSDKKIAVSFLDGKSGVFDVTPYIRGEFFRQLEDEEYFKKVRLFFNGVGWPNGQDLGPDTIHAELISKKNLLSKVS